MKLARLAVQDPTFSRYGKHRVKGRRCGGEKFADRCATPTPLGRPRVAGRGAVDAIKSHDQKAGMMSQVLTFVVISD
jgi:hypothetical protein